MLSSDLPRELAVERDAMGRFVFDERGLVSVKNVRTGGSFKASSDAFAGISDFVIDDSLGLDPFRPMSVDEDF